MNNSIILQQLADIYNNLLQVQTSGHSSFIMTDNLRNLYNIIKWLSEQKEEENNGNEAISP